ncbi:unnamed protein product, partial [Mesorhabditis belari]|uniref:Glycosyltransferase family 92 protein n=2 Tax=Mesorhabditis belari TaxID=2138241 RepID=A0AAF3F8Y8_9BILA
MHNAFRGIQWSTRKVLLIFIITTFLLVFALRVKNDGSIVKETHYQAAQAVVNQASDFMWKIRNSILSSGTDGMFEPMNTKRFRLADGSLKSDELFVWYAFYDLRDPEGPRIRILINALCKDLKKEDVMIDLGDGDPPLPLAWAEVLGTAGCPGSSGCIVQEMELSSIVYRGKVPEKINILRKSKSVQVKLHRLPTSYKDDINTCIVAPLYWFNDWPRLFLSLEWWRRNKSNKLLMHIHSMSPSAKKVIDYYIEQGFLEIRPFPMMPFTKEFDPNNLVYYGAEHLTTFFCSIWSDTKYTTMNDIDEMFWVRNKSDSLLNIARRLMDPVKHPDIAALGLEANALAFPDGIAPKPWSFNKFRRLEFVKKAHPFHWGGLSKYIYLTQYAKLPWIHGMRMFYAGKRSESIPKEQAVMLHMRNSFLNTSQGNKVFPEYQMFEDEALPELDSILGEIFGEELPDYKTPETMPIVVNCTVRSISEIPGQACNKPTGRVCYEAVQGIDEWLLAVPTEDSQFIVV